MINLEQLKYPIGPYSEPAEISDEDVDNYIRTIKNFYARLKNLVGEWSDEQLDTQYRPDGWTVRQLVNHLADVSMINYIRFKLALTEDNPTVNSFNQQKWAELQDSFTIEIKPALQTIKGVHKRWTYELKSLTNKELEFCFSHPERKGLMSLRRGLAYCCWHCDHHLAHLQKLKEQEGW